MRESDDLFHCSIAAQYQLNLCVRTGAVSLVELIPESFELGDGRADNVCSGDRLGEGPGQCAGLLVAFFSQNVMGSAFPLKYFGGNGLQHVILFPVPNSEAFFFFLKTIRSMNLELYRLNPEE